MPAQVETKCFGLSGSTMVIGFNVERGTSMFRSSCFFGLVLLVSGVGAPHAVADDPLPFHGQVTATWDNIFNGLLNPPANFTGGGPVTHMGDTKQSGWLVLEAPVAPGIYPGYGAVTITASNGDQLTFNYDGFLNAATGEGTGNFTFTGGTGRFADATGGGTFDALIDLSLQTNQTMTVSLVGQIDY
jgi:hypothetical protein